MPLGISTINSCIGHCSNLFTYAERPDSHEQLSQRFACDFATTHCASLLITGIFLVNAYYAGHTFAKWEATKIASNQIQDINQENARDDFITLALSMSCTGSLSIIINISQQILSKEVVLYAHTKILLPTADHDIEFDLKNSSESSPQFSSEMSPTTPNELESQTSEESVDERISESPLEFAVLRTFCQHPQTFFRLLPSSVTYFSDRTKRRAKQIVFIESTKHLLLVSMGLGFFSYGSYLYIANNPQYTFPEGVASSSSYRHITPFAIIAFCCALVFRPILRKMVVDDVIEARMPLPSSPSIFE